MSYLMQPIEELQRAVIAALEGEGFAYNPLTTEFPAYLATCLGSANAYKTKSVTQMLSELNVQFGGSAISRLTSGYTQLLDTLGGTIAGSGGGGGDYVASAVHFDGNAALHLNSLACTDNAFWSMSGWFKKESGFNWVIPWVTDPQNNYNNNSRLSQGTDPQNVIVSFQNGPSQLAVKNNPGAAAATWLHVLVSVDTNHAEGLKIAKLYINDVDVTLVVTDNGDAFDMVGNGVPFWVGNDASGEDPFDVADLWLAPGVSLLNGGGDIPEATRRLFIDADGKPVDPSGFPASAMLFSGDAAAFQTNQGTGGALTLTGSLTDASTSPSD